MERVVKIDVKTFLLAIIRRMSQRRRALIASDDDEVNIKRLVKEMEEAKRHYFETGEPIMEDYEYDTEEMILAREAPDASVLKAVGAPPEENVVKLPIPMPSLDKVKPSEKSWIRWLAKQEGEMQWSSKLDGISALWIPSEGRLYNRGDGSEGTDLSRFIPIIAGLSRVSGRAAPKMIRGEILIRRAEAPKEAKSIRSWVNGVLHRKEGEPLPPTGLLRFVAYKIVDSSAPIKEQFAALKAANYELPPHGYFQINDRNREGVEPMMIQLYQSERAEGPYEIDGIVLTSATVKPEKPTIENPKDTVAFKMSLAEQIAETTVTEVEWNLSRGGLLIPRVIINPVTIGGATISKVTGHNAKFIVDSGIGPGATVNIRRSGDVIPIIDTVLVPVEAALPPKGTFKWDGVHIKPAAEGSTGDPARKLLHSLKVLGIKGAGEAAASELVKGGYLTIFDINKATTSTLQALIGTSNGKKLKESITAAIEAADLTTQILSFPDLPPGLGSSRIEIFVNAGADFDGPLIEGFGPQTWASLQAAKKDIKSWISRFPAKAPINKVSVTTVPSKGPICFTGFRLKPDEKARVEAAGWIPKDSFASTCKFLIVPSLPYESTKVDSAKKFGIPIIDRDTFMRLHL